MLSGITNAKTSALIPNNHRSLCDLLERSFSLLTLSPRSRDALSLLNSVLIFSSKVVLTLRACYKIKKTEAITSAAWLSAYLQILGFAPPSHNGFAISGYLIFLR
jgi:hypothetical protein